MSIYLVRHGQDEEEFRGGWSQRGLIQEGIRQSEQLGRYLNENKQLFNIHRMVSSDLSRALETANEIAKEFHLLIEISDNWRETNNGVIAGMPNALVNERYPGLYFSSLRMDERYPGGESPNEYFTRIKDTFEKLCEEQIEKKHAENILIVTHGGVINVIYYLLKGLEWSNNSNFFPVSNTSLHKIENLNGKWEITIENLTEYL